MLKITKFGGSSCASAEQFRKVKAIIEADPSRRFVVISAAGRKTPKDNKLTDLLYLCRAHIEYHVDCQPVFDLIKGRLLEIKNELGLDTPIEEELSRFREALPDLTIDDIASRGEYFTSRLMADFLGFPFVDAKDVVAMEFDGTFNFEKTTENLKGVLQKNSRFVMPGFYGTTPDGKIKVMTRGGSDISGSILARCLKADLYENWTDVSGFLMADPRIVPHPREISSITYKELRELSYMGASVLHEDAMFPVHKAGIPTNIRNTNDPSHPGTIISLNAPHDDLHPTITGIAGHKGFSVISIEKAMMNSELGFGRKVLQAFEENSVSFEHLPTGIDTLCVVVSGEVFAPKRDIILSRIVHETNPDTITVYDNMSIIATVGRGMVHNCGTAARLFAAMSKAGINVRMIDQGSSELSIIVGVNDADYESTIQAIYNAFVK